MSRITLSGRESRVSSAATTVGATCATSGNDPRKMISDRAIATQSSGPKRQQSPPIARIHFIQNYRRTLEPHSHFHPFRRWFGHEFAPALIALLLITYTTSCIPASEGVDCFKCSSRNGSNPACEDPFHNINTTRVISPILPEPHPNVIYHTPCYAGRKGRDGLFPASACIKLTGIFDTTGETLVVRHCALDSGSLTQDTELARMSHCGKFQFEGDLLRGCVLACPEDACNSAPLAGGQSNALAFLVWLLTTLSVCFIYGHM